MNAKLFISIIAVVIVASRLHAQEKEVTDSLSRELQEIVVTAKQPATKLVGSTLVSVISGSNLENIGNALDVLSQLPMINVQNNTVRVIGKNNIEVYIDGRPMHDGMELLEILSSNLKKVELIMAPGSEYASNVGAVLKITTKKNFVKGLSISDQFQLLRRRKWSARDRLNLNYREGLWDFFLNSAINHDNTVVNGMTTNTLCYLGKETVIGGRQHNTHRATVGSLKAGFNYGKGERSFGSYYRYNPERGAFCNDGNEWIDSDAPLRRVIDKDTRSQSHLVSAYYENRFSGKYTLHFDVDYRRSITNNAITTTYGEALSEDVNSTDCRKSTLLAGKLYLNFPLGCGSYTIGTLGSYTQTDLDYRMLNSNIEDYIPSSLTDARQISTTLFTSWSALLGKFSLSAGVRYEYVDYDFKVNGKRDNGVSRRDNLFTPDISLGYSFNKGTQLSLSYKTATVKPPYSQLTGSLSYVGRHEIEGGNPALKDEQMHDLQFFGMWNDFMLQVDGIRSFDAYGFAKQLYPADNLQLLMHPINIDLSSLSIYMIWSKAIKWWSPNVTIGMYKQWLDMESVKHNTPIMSYNFDNTLNLPNGWMITANLSGHTRGDMSTNRFKNTVITMDASVGKTFLNKSLIVKFAATDIFNTSDNGWSMNTFGVTVDKRQKYDNRGLSLNIIYQFNPRKSKYKGSAAAESEIKRL